MNLFHLGQTLGEYQYLLREDLIPGKAAKRNVDPKSNCGEFAGLTNDITRPFRGSED